MTKQILIFLIFVTFSLSQKVYLQFGPNLPPGVQPQVLSLFGANSNFIVTVLSPSSNAISTLTAGSYLVALGNTASSHQVLNYTNLSSSPAQTIMVYNDVVNGIFRIVADGNPLNSNEAYSIGAGFAAYRALEILGFGFLHPFEPITPPNLKTWSNKNLQVESPYWPVRGSHYHTEHPLELVEVLQGMGLNASIIPDDPTFEAMLPEVALLGQWLLATRQTRFEWVLLCADEWEAFCNSTLRQQRLQAVNAVFHNFSIWVGPDVPIANIQQHAWYMINATSTLAEEYSLIEQRINWILEADFDFISSESGFSEFTAPNDTRMLEWMTYAANYAMSQGSSMYIKCHCSTGQTCPNYNDPRTGQPLNFNFLPMLANTSLGIYPHTVQMYNLSDPAPTYGNQNFTYMLDFITYEAPTRPTIYHGETTYWVGYDINVPLFLPQYIMARLQDMRTIAKAPNGSYVEGEMVFTSGWEWSYWLHEIANARISWNPRLEISDDEEALVSLLSEVLEIFGSQTAGIVDLIVDVINAEHQLMVLGQPNGQPAPANVTYLNGIAYLIGWDTLADIMTLQSPSTSFLPLRVPLLTARDPLFNPKYPAYSAVLDQMALNFTNFANQFTPMVEQVPGFLYSFLSELRDTMNMTALRATQIANLYEYIYLWDTLGKANTRQQLLNNSMEALRAAAEVVVERETYYRVPLERIASWRKTPTSYDYTYLWTVHSLYYFWRDHDIATIIAPGALTPCYMNIISYSDIYYGEGNLFNESEQIYDLLSKFKWTDPVVDCLAPPNSEPVYPLYNKSGWPVGYVNLEENLLVE